jgi:hypothetical protein
MSMIDPAIRESSLEWLMSKWIAVKEGRYPCKTNPENQKYTLNKIRQEIRKRIPDGCIFVWDEKKARR